MSVTEHFFDSLIHQKAVLDNSPFLDSNSQRGLESSYCLLHNIIKPSATRQTQNRHDKARQHLRNVYSIAKPLFVLVGVTISITDLASLDHKEVFPRLETWWQNNAPPKKFESRAIELIHELDHEKETFQSICEAQEGTQGEADEPNTSNQFSKHHQESIDDAAPNYTSPKHFGDRNRKPNRG